MSEVKDMLPEPPLVLINPRFVEGVFDKNSSRIHRVMKRESFERGIFKKDTFVFDSFHRKFEIVDVVAFRAKWPWAEKLRMRLKYSKPSLRVEYRYKFIEQMKFNEIVEIVTDHICKKRWYGQTGGTEASFREYIRENCRSMEQLAYQVQFYGKWMR